MKGGTVEIQYAFPFGDEVRNVIPKSDHHLQKKPDGFYQMRVVIDRGPKFIGKRRTIYLRTKCLHEAKEKRDLILKVLNDAKKIFNESNRPYRESYR